MRLLLVEDDRMIGKAMKQGLTDAGFTVDWVTDGPSAERALTNGVYQLAVLDLGLPGKDGMTVLRDLRARRDHLPVLVVTARDAVADRIAGLNAGADDYVLKPFNLDELDKHRAWPRWPRNWWSWRTASPAWRDACRGSCGRCKQPCLQYAQGNWNRGCRFGQPESCNWACVVCCEDVGGSVVGAWGADTEVVGP